MEPPASPETPPSYDLQWPADWRAPVVVSVPHSGRDFPADFEEQAARRVPFERLEDPFLDRLTPGAHTLAAPVLTARYGRAYVDVNRAPTEWDQAMFGEALPRHLASSSSRVKAGLGTFPRFVPPRSPVNRRRLTIDQGMERWRNGYRPYHRTLKRLLHACRARFGYAILLDVHSMPQLPGERLPDLVVGDSFGRACSAAIPQTAVRAAQGIGLSVARNYPYAGGFITQNYGVPAQGFHALQLEFARPLYMDEEARTLKPGQAYVIQTIATVVEQFGQLDPALLRPAPAALAGED